MTTSSVPATAHEWPDRGAAIAAWLDLGVDCYQQLAEAHGFEPTQDSLAAHDRLTLTPNEPRHASAGSWFALLTMAGCAEMIRALATLYRGTRERPLTRGHLPIVRSIQEHIGRVVWLCEPGAIVSGPNEPIVIPTEDDWGERRFRSLLAHREWMNDCASHLEMARDPDAEDARAASLTAAAEVDRSRATRPHPPTSFPGSTGFASKAQETTERLHGAHGIPAPTMGYKRLSESSHGGLYGLHGDKTRDEEQRYVFEQVDSDLDAIANTVAAWWVTGVLFVSALHGWDADKALTPFTDVWTALSQEAPPGPRDESP